MDKIPQLLTSKLPLFEFEKNQDKFEQENEQAAKQRIQTASQITAFQIENKRMETV